MTSEIKFGEDIGIGCKSDNLTSVSFDGQDCVYPFTGAGRQSILHNQMLIVEMLIIAITHRWMFIYNNNETVSKRFSNA